MSLRRESRCASTIGIFVLLLASGRSVAEADEGWLIHLGASGKPSLVTVRRPSFQLKPQSQGMLVWTTGAHEHWTYVPPGGTWQRPSGLAEGTNSFEQIARSRGQGADPAGSTNLRPTRQVDQLLGRAVFRGAGFVTPQPGLVLNGRITIRRAQQGQQPLEAASAVLQQGSKTLATFSFAAGQEKLVWAEIPELAAIYPDGLPAGDYTMRMVDTAESTSFAIEDQDWAAEVMAPLERFEELTGERYRVLYLHVACEHLLDQKDEDDQPTPYLTDVLDLLDGVQAERLPTHLSQLRARILAREPSEESGQAAIQADSGVATIDAARQLIADGRWNQALAELDKAVAEGDPRATGLATLYRAVILAESGLGTESLAGRSFEKSLAQLAPLNEPSDLYLAHNNYAGFLLGQMQDRLYNHAFQMATGAKAPLTRSLQLWQLAERHYDKAARLAADLGPGEVATQQLNQARLYMLLADVIRTLDANPNGREFAAGEQAAAAVALQCAEQVDLNGQELDAALVAAAAEIRAQLAYRAQDIRCVELAEQSLAAYANAGSLLGAESVHRMLGLCYCRHEQFATDATAEDSRQNAIRHLRISMELAEFLQGRIPRDRIGLSQAGFFARRAYVNERLIELAVQQGDGVVALEMAEQAKARALEDVLLRQRAGDSEEYLETDEPIRDILKQWPARTAALQYFVGTEKIWLMLVDPEGQVHACELSRAGPSRQFVQDAAQLLQSLQHQASQMKRQLGRRQGLDHSWQQRLHEFYQALLPAGFLERLQEAETVVVIPHHVLHYFPFAALVVECDSQPRSPQRQVRPRFLMDERFDLVYSPSLRLWARYREQPARELEQARAIGIVHVPGAPPLPGVDRDLQNLQTAFGDRVTQLTSGAEASESSVYQALSSPGLLLLATHGHNVADAPLSSHLLVMPGRDGDGRITAGELFVHPVEADLIVMSACYSGLADRTPLPGDDLFGIQRALLKSGARTVVSGLWDVYDGTAPELMNEFFLQLARGLSAPAALAASQREFLAVQRRTEDGWLIHPYFWAVYTASGDDRTRFATVTSDTD